MTTRQLDAMLPDGVAEVEDFRERWHALEASTRHAVPGVCCGTRDMGGEALVRDMSIRRPYLEHIVKGHKTVEVRVAYPSMRKIQPGQQIRFVSGDEDCLTAVRHVATYSSFDELLAKEDPATIAPDITSTSELLRLIREIYPPEKEALGVLAIHIERIEQPSGG